jgi:hypothetical protein
VSGAKSLTSAVADAAHDRLAAARSAIDALRGRPVLDDAAAVRAADQVRRFARERLDEARLRRERSDGRAAQAAALVLALRARAHETGLADLEQRLTRLRDEERAAAGALRRAQEGAASITAAIERVDADGAAARRVVAEQDEQLAAESTALAAAAEVAGSPIDDVERWARVTQRGDQFRSLDAIEDALRRAQIAEASRADELDGDGSRGVRHLAHASRFGFTFARADARVLDRKGAPLSSVLAEVDRSLAEQREIVNERTRALMDTLVMGTLARELQGQVRRLGDTVRDMNRLLDGLAFGTTRYQFRVTPRPERAELVRLVERVSLLDEASRARFRAFVDERLDELRRADDTEIPELLDYRRWFDYRLVMKSGADAETELTRELRALGSGGEQGVPNYLLVLALAKLGLDAAHARLRPLLFDEAFYGIDAARRDQLLRFATDLGIQLVVASPDQDGVTPAVRAATTLFLVKDEHGDVHLAPYHFWSRAGVPQLALLGDDEPDPSSAICEVAPAR